MALFQMYIDEDAVHGGLVDALRSRDVTVITAADAGLMKKSDDNHLASQQNMDASSTRSTSPISIGFMRNGSMPVANMPG